MKNRYIFLVQFMCAAVMIAGTLGCSADYHAGKVQKGLEGDSVTVGTVQREIRVGMSSADVIEALGSPNVVTTDEQRREVWGYDKIATDIQWLLDFAPGWSISRLCLEKSTHAHYYCQIR
ncbi:MAG: hypothetical protein ACYSX1_10225 [Planctomycetota bacterium]|jgi:hypothetical protein